MKVRNPGGQVHSVPEDHPSVALAKEGKHGWSLVEEEPEKKSKKKDK